MGKAQPYQCAYRQAAVRANYVEGAKLKSNVESSRAMWKAQYQQCAYRQAAVDNKQVHLETLWIRISVFVG